MNLIFLNFQGWPTAELSPVQALLIMIAYEKRTRKTIDQKDMEAGKIQLHEILTQEDFKNAGKVSEFCFNIFNNGT